MNKNKFDKAIVPLKKSTDKLPKVASITGNMLNQLTDALGVDRSVVALDQQIEQAWSQLPRLIRRIPSELCDEQIVKACISVASGLFDSAINYMWNASIVALRDKVRRFGLQVIPQILDDKSFDEASLLDLKDAELLDLCLKLNLITIQSSFFLDQCRAMRNNYSVAHPFVGSLDEDEVITFFSRCQKHALSNLQNPKGVDTKELLISVKSTGFKSEQLEEWGNRLRKTFDAQRELIFGMLHGVYCDPDVNEAARVNALSICKSFSDEFTPKTKSMLVDRHQNYRAKGDESRYIASRQFFENIELLSLLSDAEKHSFITSASQNLLRVHNDWNNFHNEPPFAERLARLTNEIGVPESAQAVFVESVVTCGIGNDYGVSHAAVPSYKTMAKSFSPREIKIMLELPKKSDTLVARLLSRSPDCAKRFVELVRMVDKSSVPTTAKAAYYKWILPRAASDRKSVR